MALKYYLTKKELATVKRAAKFMGLHWQAEAARPASARRLCTLVAEHGTAVGCEKWAAAGN